MDAYGPDKYYWPVTVEDDATEIRIYDQEVDETLEVSIEAGDYYQYLGSELKSGFSPLLQAVEDEINSELSDAGGSEQYTLEAATPSGSDLQNSGLRFAKDTTANQFKVEFDHADWDYDPRLLGWPEGEDSDQTSQTGDSEQILDSPLSLWGQTQSYTNFSNNAASEKLFDEEAVDEQAGEEDPFDGYAYDWLIFEARTIVYPWVPALHLFEDADQRGASSTHRDNAGLPDGDTHNTFYRLWKIARKRQKFVLVHDDGDQGHTLPDDQWEIGVIRPSQHSQFSDLYDVARRKGEFFDVTLELAISDSDYTY